MEPGHVNAPLSAFYNPHNHTAAAAAKKYCIVAEPLLPLANNARYCKRTHFHCSHFFDCSTIVVVFLLYILHYKRYTCNTLFMCTYILFPIVFFRYNAMWSQLTIGWLGSFQHWHACKSTYDDGDGDDGDDDDDDDDDDDGWFWPASRVPFNIDTCMPETRQQWFLILQKTAPAFRIHFRIYF